jgi:transposase
MKDLNITARYIAKKFNVSDTFVHDVFLQYIDCHRLPLPPVLAIDEVLIDFNYKNRYALVLMNFVTGEIVDILPNRYKSDYEKYFLSIPLSERNQVKAIVCDMYNPYVNFSVNYFHQAEVVIDSFHVIQWINHKITIYINNVKKKYQQKDQDRLEDKNFSNNRAYKTIKQSKEVYILNNYKWVLLTPGHRINYSTHKKWNHFLNQYLCTYDYENSFMSLDSNFRLIRELRDRYIHFNEDFPKNFSIAAEQLDTLISFYSKSSLQMFRDFSDLLKKYHDEICNSFKTLEHYSNEAYLSSISNTSSNLRRLSNGPMEGFNRKPKDLKRNSRGVDNIRYTINRIICSNRSDEPIRYTPIPIEEVRISTGFSRGPYKKK